MPSALAATETPCSLTSGVIITPKQKLDNSCVQHVRQRDRTYFHWIVNVL